MAQLNFFDFTNGSIPSISPFMRPAQSLASQDGCNTTWKLGTITKELGYNRQMTVAQADKPITGAYDFQQSSSVQKFLFTCNDSTDDDTQLFYDNTGTATEITGAEVAWANKANINVEMAKFLDIYCFFVGYGATDGFITPASLTGTTFSTSTNVTGMPNGKYIVASPSRLYVLNVNYGSVDYPGQMIASSIPASGSITWSTATAPNPINITFDEDITGGVYHAGLIIIFTKTKAYYYEEASRSQGLLWEVGCSNHRTIKKHGPYLIWANEDGIWVSQGAGFPKNYVFGYIDFIRGVNMSNAFAELVDEEYHLYIGNVTPLNDSIGYSNCKLVLHTPSWTIRSRQLGHSMSTFTKFYNRTTGQYRLYMGASNGGIYSQSKYIDSTIYTSDGAVSSATDGLDITSRFELSPIVVDPSSILRIKKLIAYAERAQNLKLYARVLDNSTRILTDYKPIGELRQYINTYDMNVSQGSIIQIQGVEYGKDPYWQFYGLSLEIDKVSNIKINQ